MKRIYIVVICSLLGLNMMAQSTLDRSKRPKGGPAPVINISDPAMYKLSNGITVLVVENHKLPKVNATYFIDAGPITEGAKTGTVSIMGEMLKEGTTSMDKAKFDEAVDRIGADVNLGSSGGTVSALTRYFDKAFGLMADAIQHPAFPQESFEKIKSQTLTGLKANEKSAKAISSNVVPALSYGLNHPEGEFETEATINNITLEDIKKAYATYITPSRGYITFVGDIKPEDARALAEKAFGNWKGATLTLPQIAVVPNPAKTEIDLVDVPNAVQSEITVTNLVELPMSNPDYFPLLIANQILGGGSDARLFMNLREKHGFTYGSYSSIGAGRYQTSFKATSSVRNEKTDSAVGEILNEINRIRTEKITDEELTNAKALYNGNFARQMENPARTADFASNILVYDLPKDFYRTYLQKINAVTTDDVQRVAQKYFNYGNTRVVVVGKEAVVSTGLAKLGYTVNRYDRYAKPVESKAVVAVTAAPKEIISRYILAIGGADALKKINTISYTGDMAVQGMKLGVVAKKMNPNLELMQMSMGANTVMKEVFDGTAGSSVQGPQKRDMTADEIKEKKDAKHVFPELFYNDGSYKLEVTGTDKVQGKDAYKLKVTGASGKATTQYYDIASGLLVKEESTTSVNGQDVTQSVEYSDYKKVGAVSLPFTNTITAQSAMGSQEFVITFTDIKVNEGVTAGDFK